VKQWGDCQRWLPYDDFYKHSRSLDGYQWRCKCERTRDRSHDKRLYLSTTASASWPRTVRVAHACGRNVHTDSCDRRATDPRRELDFRCTCGRPLQTRHGRVGWWCCAGCPDAPTPTTFDLDIREDR
jgi:hypothetical protein